MSQVLPVLRSFVGEHVLISENRIKPLKPPDVTAFTHDIRVLLPAEVPGDIAVPGHFDAHPDGVTMEMDDLMALMDRSFQGKLVEATVVHLGDSHYYLPTQDEFDQLVRSTSDGRRAWTENRYDCDDFSYVFKAHASSIAYINSEITCGFAVGMVWGKFEWLDGLHACNFVVHSNQVVELFEPQTDRCYPMSKMRPSSGRFVAL